MCAAVRAAEKEGCVDVGIDAVSGWRFFGGDVEMPETDSPYVYVVLGGILRLFTPSGIMDYGEGQYFVSKIDMPLRGKAVAPSAGGDFVAVSIEFSVSDVISTTLRMDDELIERILGAKMTEEEMSLADEETVCCAARLFRAKERGALSGFLRGNIVSEMICHILCGSCGRQFLQSMANVGQADGIYEANSWIKENFRTSFSVEELAARQNMSVSQFHRKFRSAVGMGPLQCQKRLRMTEARRLMLDEGRNVTETAAEVGYESLSQFIRDYKKMFGAAPKEDIAVLRGRLK